MSIPQWQPPQQGGRDPRIPFGAPQQPSQQPAPQIEDYQQPRTGLGRTLVIVIAVVTVIGATLIGLQFLGSPQAAPTPDPSRIGPSAIKTSLGASSTSIPFDGYGTGTFEIISRTWGDRTLDVEIKVTLTEGQGTYTTYAFSNETMASADPVEGDPFHISSGESKVAHFQFYLEHSEATLVLATSGGKPVTALQITP